MYNSNISCSIIKYKKLIFDFIGHQKKLMLAVKRLAEMQRSSEGRGSLRKKPPPITQQQEVMSLDSPPNDGR